MNPYVLFIAAVAFMVAVGAAGYKGYSLGGAAARAECQAAVLEAKAAADAERERLSEEARKSAKGLQTALFKEKALKNDLSAALQAHIRTAKPPPAGCPSPEFDSGLLDIWNRANAGPDSAPGRSLPPAGGAAAKPEAPRP